jgi:XTP/dITP diphosphohydrolase
MSRWRRVHEGRVDEEGAITSDIQFIIATGNPGKRREFEELLADLVGGDWQIYDRGTWPGELDEVVEDRGTFRGNAIEKALQTSRATGVTALADDSGLLVDALDGAPGVYSARFAGPEASADDNNRKLVESLRGVADHERTARYAAVLALAIADDAAGRILLERAGFDLDDMQRGEPDRPGAPGRLDDRVVVWSRGTVEGRIVDEPRGSGGFGYDPHFFVPSRGCTMAELTLEEKNVFSHRAEAARTLAGYFR